MPMSFSHPAVGVMAIACAWMSALCLPASASETPLIVRNATVFDATGNAPYVADVLVEDGRFAAIGKNIAPPDGAQVIDAQGLSLLPGLIDVHVHWTNADEMTRSDVATALLLSGVTTATDFHSSPESFAPKRSWQEGIISPHVVYTARMGVPGGHGADWGDENMTRLAVTPDEGRAAIKALEPYRPDAIKVFADGWRYGNGAEENSVNIVTLSSIVEAAAAEGLPVVTHTVTVEQGKIAAQAGVSAIVHAIQDQRVDDELVALMRDNNIIYAPTLAVYEPRPDKMANVTDDILRRRIEERQTYSRYNLKRLVKSGVKVAVGTDSGIGSTPFGESSLRELELLVDFGLTPEQALIAGTTNSAEALKIDEDRGTIEVGKRADFVLVRGKPWRRISDYRNLENVFVDGRVVAKEGALVSEQGAPAPLAIAATRIIDSFERDDGNAASNAMRLSDVDTGFPRSLMISQRVPRDSSGSALGISAKMALKDSPRAFITLPLSEGGFSPVDATAYRGVRFDVRGEGEYEAGLVTASGSAAKNFGAGGAWRTIEIEFGEFQSVSEGEQLSLDAVYMVKFGARRDPGHTFWLEIDNVAFF